jgi:hypothetical protein
VRGDVVDLFPMAAAAGVRLEFFDRPARVDPHLRSEQPAHHRGARTLRAGARRPKTAEAGPVVKHLTPSRTLVIAYEPLRIEERHGAADLVRQRPAHTLDQRTAGHAAAVPAPRHVVVAEPRPRLQACCRPVQRRRQRRGRPRWPFAQRARRAGPRAAVLPQRGRTRAPARDLRAQAGRPARRAGRAAARRRSAAASASPTCRPPRCRTSSSPACRSRRVCANGVAVPSRAIQSFFELGPGDLVVHAVHGIARFEGTELVHRGEGTEEHLRLCFQDEVKLLVPASKIHLVQKYVGSGGKAPLDKLGGKGFQRARNRSGSAVRPRRRTARGAEQARARAAAAVPARPLERDFLDTFPFRDTVDQARAWSEIQPTSKSPSPMDRLLCGDVGFGKTEIALRTAFRVAIQPAARSPCWRRRRSSPSSTPSTFQKRCEAVRPARRDAVALPHGRPAPCDRRRAARRAPSTSSSARTSCSARTSSSTISPSSSSTRSSASACGRRSASSSCAPRSTC